MIPRIDEHVSLRVDPRFHVKDPTTTDLGRAIVGQGLLLIDELGYEGFTFRKLAARIGTTEASIYRYFRSKHRLLLYLTVWYWTWTEHRVAVATVNVVDPKERLRLALREITQPIEPDDRIPHIDESVLYRVVVAESPKVYLHRDVNAENREGLYLGYKRLCRTVANMIVAVAPAYRYPVALVSTVMESSHMQRYYSEHLPRLTDVDRAHTDASTTEFLTEMVFKTITAPTSTSRARPAVTRRPRRHM